MSGSQPVERAFTELCLWLLERYGGDPRFQSLGPAPRGRGDGISLATDEFSRLEISLPVGEQEIFLGFVTKDRTRFDQLVREIESRGETASGHVEACLERVGHAEQPHVETWRDGESGFAMRLALAAETLSSAEGRERVRFCLEGFYVAFPQVLVGEAGRSARQQEHGSSTGGETSA